MPSSEFFRRAALLAVLPLAIPMLGCAPGDEPERGRSENVRTAAEAIEDLASRLCADLADLSLEAVTSRDFHDLRGDTSELGRYLSQEVSSALTDACAATPDAPRVIDRQRVADTLKERRFEAQGLVSREDRRTGRIGGVDGLVTGKVTSFADEIELSIQVIEYGDAGAVLAAETVRIPRAARHNELEGRTLQVSRKEEIDIDELRAEGPPLASWPAGPPETFLIDLQGCGRVEDAVYCLFKARSVGQDRSFSLQITSRAVLPDGTRIQATEGHLGPSTIAGPKGSVGSTLVAGVPMAVALRFTDVPPGTRELLFVTLDFHGGEATFEDVPISRY